MADFYTVFIDTTLDTHLAFIVSASDTVSDLKKKILQEHKLCFPTNGDIKIHALKVKRRGIFYHLSESMFVKSAFDGTGKNWFVSVDASTIEENIDNLAALVGTTNNGSTDEVNLLPDSHPKSFSSVVDLSLQLDESSRLAKQKASVAEQLGLDFAGNEELNNSSIAAYKGDCYRKVMSLADDKNGSDPPILEKYDEPGKEKEVQATPTGSVGGGSGDGIGDMQGSAPSDEALTTGSGAKKKNKRKRTSKDITDDLAGKEKEASECQSGENESQQESAANKRRKIEEENRGDGSVKENDIVLSDSNKEISKHPTISQHHLVNNQKNAHTALHCLSSETLDGLSLPAASQGSGKGKKKKKSVNPLNLETADVPSFTDVTGETMEVNPKDFCKEPDTVPVPVQGLTISESCAVSVKEKHTDPVQEDGRPSSQGVDMSDTDTTNAKSRHDAPELAAASTGKKRSPKNTILDDSQRPATNQVNGLEGEREALYPGSMLHEKCKPSDMRSKEAVNSSELVEAGETVYPGTHSKKRKKSKGTRALLSTTLTLDTKNVKSSTTADAASIEPHKDVNGDDSNYKGNQEDSNLAEKEMEEVSEMDKDVAVTSQLAEASEAVNPGTSSKKKKKSKRMKDLLSRTPGSGTENANSSAAAATSSNDHHKAASGDDSKDKVNQEESNLHAKEGKEVVEMDKVVVTSELVEASETVNPGTPSKKRKKSKKTTDLLIRTPASGTEHVNISAAADAASTEPHEAVNGNDSNDKVNQVEINLLEKEGKEVLEVDKEVVVTSELVEASEAVNCGTPSKKRKKSKRTRDLLSGTPTSGTEPNSSVADTSPTEPHNSVNGDDSNDNGNKEENSMAAKKGKVVLEMDAASTFRLATDTEIDDVIENVVKSAVNGCPSKIDHSDKAGHGMEVSCGSDRINYNEYFVPNQDHSKTAASGEVLVDKATKAKQVGGMNSNKKKKKLDALSRVPSFDLHGSSRLNVNDGIGEKPPAGGVKVSPSSKSDKISSTPAEGRKAGALGLVVTNTFAKNNKEPSAASYSSLESSRKTRARGHGSNKQHNQTNGGEVSPANVEGVVNSSQHKKSLIGKSGTIFEDDNYEHSAEERTDSSDSSTRTPDNSLSSDYSDGESNSDFNSSQNGYYCLKSKEGGGKNIKKPLSGLTLERILRSSSRYKKAKLTVSQLEDTENEPVDFVPDSQANP
ncbi:COP1-interacting protein 4.1 [Populus alba x Populus x berolinensis]|nr:COP1-interacting protein 4.1 [Populus alba x Populus x berolinensis]KAJ6898337.1 COP1-interacting protein 4.1 [Populus alba x Populus x berolinensis]